MKIISILISFLLVISINAECTIYDEKNQICGNSSICSSFRVNKANFTECIDCSLADDNEICGGDSLSCQQFAFLSATTCVNCADYSTKLCGGYDYELTSCSQFRKDPSYNYCFSCKTNVRWDDSTCSTCFPLLPFANSDYTACAALPNKQLLSIYPCVYQQTLPIPLYNQFNLTSAGVPIPQQMDQSQGNYITTGNATSSDRLAVLLEQKPGALLSTNESVVSIVGYPPFTNPCYFVNQDNIYFPMGSSYPINQLMDPLINQPPLPVDVPSIPHNNSTSLPPPTPIQPSIPPTPTLPPSTPTPTTPTPTSPTSDSSPNVPDNSQNPIDLPDISSTLTILPIISLLCILSSLI